MAERYGNIIGWGKYVPEKIITNADLEAIIDTTDEKIIALTGISERHVVDDSEQTSQMAIGAAREALEMASVRPQDLDLIIVATSSPDYLTPPISSQVQHALGAKKVGALTLVTGCTGFIYSLATAQQFIQSGNCERILVIGAELISRWIDYTDRTMCILFGDGAGAVVLEATEKPSGILSFVLGSDGSKADLLILPGGGSRHPPSQEMLDRKLHYVQMNGREVFRFATKTLGRALRKAIKEAGMQPEDIDLFIPHQSNKRLIESIAQQVGLPKDKIFINIDKYGNTSAASIPIALCEAFNTGKAKVGDTLAFTALGAGLTWATAIVKVVEREKPPKTWFQRLPILGRFSKEL